MAADNDKLNAFLGRFVNDLGAAVHAGMMVIGDHLGHYKALATGFLSSSELAGKTGTDERYVREWLASPAAGGYITYDAEVGKFSVERGAGLRPCRRTPPGIHPGRFRAGARIPEGRAAHH
ncbi:MAG TPA: hypothetical protein VN823_09355 [Stellaceae bacterium]|nr:hypothetical protein [Stellaceae bacterium]